MKRAKWAFILMSFGMGMSGGFLSSDPGWLGILGVLFTFVAGLTISAAFGFNFPMALSRRWPDLYPPEKIAEWSKKEVKIDKDTGR